MNRTAPVFNFTLSELALVDAPAEESFDNLTRLASILLNTPVSLVSLVDFDHDRQFFKSQLGLADKWAAKRQTPLTHSFCKHVVLNDKPLVVEDARSHELLKNNLAIPDLGVIAYLGIPVHGPANNPIGALCVISSESRSWSQADQDNLSMLADAVTNLIRLSASLKTSELLRQEQQDFSSVLSHDLKSPTNTLKLLHNEISNELGSDVDEQVAQLLKLCEGTTNRMSGLVEEILGYTRVTGSSADKELIDLNELSQSVISDLAAEIKSTNAIIKTSRLPVISGNAVQLRVLLQNLISNALKFVPPGIVPQVSLTVQLSDDGKTEELRVKDNGIGIAPKDHERIFGIFQRLHLRENYPGSGIGLALCKRIALNHLGNISIESNADQGSEFLVTFPVNTND